MQANKIWMLATTSIFLLGSLCWLSWPTDKEAAELFVYCAVSLRSPVEQIAAEYQEEFGTHVRLQYGGSNTLLSQATISRVGDLFFAADESYLHLGSEKGVVREIVSVATMHAVVGVPRGNPQQLRNLNDLLGEHVSLALANPDQAAIGQATRQAFLNSGSWQQLKAHAEAVGVFKPTAGDVANDIKLGSVDAGVLWDAVVRQYPEMEIVHLPELADAKARIGIGVLSSTNDSLEAMRFARFASARGQGRDVFQQQGYPPVNEESGGIEPKTFNQHFAAGNPTVATESRGTDAS